MKKTIFEKDYQKLIDDLIKIRHKKGLTQRDLAKKLDVPNSWVGRMEIYNRRLDILELIEVLKALEISQKESLDLIGKLIKAR